MVIRKRVLVSRLASIISLIPSPTRDDDTLKPFSRCRPSELSTRSWFRFRRTRESRDCVAVCLRRRVNDETRSTATGWDGGMNGKNVTTRVSSSPLGENVSIPTLLPLLYAIFLRRKSPSFERRRVTSVLRACSASLSLSVSFFLFLSFDEILFIRFCSWKGRREIHVSKYLIHLSRGFQWMNFLTKEFILIRKSWFYWKFRAW